MDTVKTGVSWLFSSLDLPSPRQLLQYSLLLNSQTTGHQAPLSASSQLNIQQQCPVPRMSCDNRLPAPNPCCVETPGGHYLLTQFWDSSPPKGPDDSWTLHGLWPDYCTGNFPQKCDPPRFLDDNQISDIVSEASQSTHPGLRTYMDTYWKGLHGDADLWSHEWNKHGTCASTLAPKCYAGDVNDVTSAATGHADLLDYLTAATALHANIKSYDLLAAKGITPSTTKTYKLKDIQDALAAGHQGLTSTVKCKRNGEISEIWTHFTVLGPLRGFNTSSLNIFHPVKPDGLITTCEADGIKYLPKGKKADPSLPNPGGAPFRGRGFLKVQVLDSTSSPDDTTLDVTADDDGCLIRTGAWLQTSSCAGYSAKPYVTTSDSAANKQFTLETGAGAGCGILDRNSNLGAKGQFVCSNDLRSKSAFDAGGRGSDLLSWDGSTTFYADRKATKSERVKVFANDGNGSRDVKVQIAWAKS